MSKSYSSLELVAYLNNDSLIAHVHTVAKTVKIIISTFKDAHKLLFLLSELLYTST